MYVVLKPSPSIAHRYRVELPSKRFIDFGLKTAEYYVDHKDPFKNRIELHRRGANISNEIMQETDPKELHRLLLYVNKSHTEEWEQPYNRDFWERWLMMSYSEIEHAKLWVTMRENILFMPTGENFWYV